MRAFSFQTSDQTRFFTQLAALLNAGLSLHHSLQLAGKDCSSRFQQYLAQVGAKVATGSSLAAAMTSPNAPLDPWTINLVCVAETSGTLAPMCQRLAIAAERQQQHQKLYRSLGFLGIATGLSCLLLLLVIIPVGQLWLRQPSFWIVLCLFVGSFGGMAFLQPRFISAIALQGLAPFPVGQQIATARTMLEFSELALPLHCGVPILTALDLLRPHVGDPVLAQALATASQAVRRGQPLSRSLQGKLPATALQFIRTGEETGNLDEMLDKLATYYEGELERLLRQLQGVLRPLSILAGGGVVLVLGVQMVRSLLNSLPG